MVSTHLSHKKRMCLSFTLSKLGSKYKINSNNRVSADILMEEIKKIRSYALLINKSIYWAHYFDVSERDAVKVSCVND